jgi:hypothetical protein
MEVGAEDLPPVATNTQSTSMTPDVEVSDMPGYDAESNEDDYEDDYEDDGYDYEDEDGDDYEDEELDEEEDVEEYVEESLTTSAIADAPSMVPKTRKKKVQKAGNPNGAVKGMKNHGETLKRKLKNDDVSESFKLPANIAKNVKAIVEHVNKQFVKMPSFNKYKRSYNVVVENNGKMFETKTTRYIAEAAADAEEISVIGKGNASIKVNLFEGNKNVGMFFVEMPRLSPRKPQILKEGAIFRFPSIARAISEQCIGSKIVHSIKKHPYGVVIKGDVGAIYESLNGIIK